MNYSKDAEVVASFISEIEQGMNEIESGLLILERQGVTFDSDLVHSMFRIIHSIKAGANLLGYHYVEDHSRRMENVFQALRLREIMPDTQTINELLEITDALRRLSNDISVPETDEYRS